MVWFAWGIKEGAVARLHQLAGSRAEMRSMDVEIEMQVVVDMLECRIEVL